MFRFAVILLTNVGSIFDKLVSSLCCSSRHRYFLIVAKHQMFSQMNLVI